MYAEYKSGKVPNPSPTALIKLAQDHGERHDVGTLVETSRGECDLGSYRSAVFRSKEYARIEYLGAQPRQVSEPRGSVGMPVTRNDAPATIIEMISDCRASRLLEPHSVTDLGRRDRYGSVHGSLGDRVR